MDTLLYFIASTLLKGIQALPLRVGARLGRAGGALFYWVDARHRRVAVKNLRHSFGTEYTEAQLRALALENFKRIGENFACAAKTASMETAEITPLLSVVGLEKIASAQAGAPIPSRVFAIGHFGNFELYPRANQYLPGTQFATTYRGLRQPSLDRLLRSLREKSGCLLFERRRDGQALKAAMKQPGVFLGFLSDQHAGDHGLKLPFLGRDCSTSAAPAVFALRYECPLHVAICYRVKLGLWRIEVGDEIPTHENGAARSVEAISLDVNRAFEAAVRRDPANWFWVHNRWKPGKWRERTTAPKPETEAEL